MKNILLLLTLITFSAFAQNPDYHRYGARTKFLQPDTLSTAQRTSLTPKLGTLIYHKDTGVSQWEQWDGDSWEELGGGAVDSVQGLTGNVVISPDDLDDFSTLNKFVTQEEKDLINSAIQTETDPTAVKLTGDETVAGIKTFSSFPITPSSAPTTDYQVANKKYVDDNAGGSTTINNTLTSTSTTEALSANMGKTLKDVQDTQQTAIDLNTAKVTFPEAPSDGTQYARKDAGWEAVPTSLAAANITVSPSIAGQTDAYAVMQANRTSIDSIQANMSGGINTTPRHVTSTTGVFTEAYNESQPNIRLTLTEDTNISITGMNAGDALILTIDAPAGSQRLVQLISADTLKYKMVNELAYFVALKDTVNGIVWQRSYPDGKTDKSITVTGTGVTEINWEYSSIYDFTHGAMNDTLVFVAPKSSKKLELTRRQDITGSRTLAFGYDIYASGGTLPTLSTAASSIDKIYFSYNKENDTYTIDNVALNLQLVAGTPPSGGTPVSYDVDAEAFMIATGIPDDATVYYASTPQEITGHELWVAIDTRIKGFKFYNLWTKIYGDYPFIGGTATTHKWNSKDPRDLDAAFRLTFSGTWTHNGVGITGNGTNTYANTHFTKNDGWTQSNIGYSFYNRSSLLETKFDFGALTVGAETTRLSIITSRATTAQMNSYMFNNSTDGSVNVSTPTILGLISVNQSGLSHKVFTNAVQQGTTNTGNVQAFFTSLTSNPMFFGGANLNNAVNLPSSRNYSHLGITDAFTDTEIANYNTVIQAFETALGREM